MKRILPLILTFSLLCSGCMITGPSLKEPVTFYYLQSSFQHGGENGIIVPEAREASGHRDSLSYLLALYQMGPASEELRSPLPAGSSIKLTELTDTQISLEVNNLPDDLPEARFSLLCACLAMTCIDLSGVQSVAITDGSQSLTLSLADLTLYDRTTTNTAEEPQ